MSTMPSEKTETLVMLPVLTVEMEGGEQARAVVVCCSVLQRVAVCVAECSRVMQSVLQSVLQRDAVSCSVS